MYSGGLLFPGHSVGQPIVVTVASDGDYGLLLQYLYSAQI